MSCGINIPLSSVVEALLNEYGDTLAKHIADIIDMSKYVTVDNGVAKNITLKDSIILDQDVIAGLCNYLQDCIAEKLEARPDDYVQGFFVDDTNKSLTIRMKSGNTYSVAKKDLDTNPDNHVQEFFIDHANDLLTVRMKGGSVYSVAKEDLEAWLSVKSSGGTDNDTYPTGGSVVNDTTIRLDLSDGRHIDIDASAFAPSSTTSSDSPYIVSAVFEERDSGYWLDFTRSDNAKVNVDMSEIIKKAMDTLRSEILGMGYTLKTENNHYTTQTDDFNGFSIIRANRNGDQTITVTKPDDSFIGKSLIVRKTNGDVGTFVTLKAGDGVTISPADSTPLRRVGSSATLVYTGEGNWDVFGELP